jgi:hypothetical protein
MEKANKLRVSVAGKPLHPSLLFSMAGTYPIKAPFNGRILDLLKIFDKDERLSKRNKAVAYLAFSSA